MILPETDLLAIDSTRENRATFHRAEVAPAVNSCADDDPAPKTRGPGP